MKIQPVNVQTRPLSPQFGAFSVAQKQALSALMATTEELLERINQAATEDATPKAADPRVQDARFQDGRTITRTNIFSDDPSPDTGKDAGKIVWSETLTRLDHELGARLFGMDPEAGVLSGLLKTIQEMPAYIPSANTFDKLLQRVKEVVGRKKGGHNGYVDPQFKQLTEAITQITES